MGNFNFELEVLSPLHIDAGGGDLLADRDFVATTRGVWVIDTDKMWDVIDESVWNQEGFDAGISQLLNTSQYEECKRYRLNNPGGGQIPQIKPQTKTAKWQPYIPGSSLKGAIRTGIAWSMVDSGTFAVTLDKIGRHRNDRNPRTAASQIEKEMFGSNPNKDLFRTLQISDTQPIDSESMRLYTAAVFALQRRGGRSEFVSKGNRFRFFLETLPPNTTLKGTIRLEDYLIDLKQGRLYFDKKRDWVENFPTHCNEFSRFLLGYAINMYLDTGLQRVAQFYEQLLQIANQLDEKRQCLLQVGWGTGWLGMTLGSALDDDTFFEVRERYRLGRPGWEFPKSCRLIKVGNQAEMPLGWVKLTLSKQ